MGLATNKGTQLYAEWTIANEGKVGLWVTRPKQGEPAFSPIFNREFI